jgi:amidase
MSRAPGLLLLAVLAVQAAAAGSARFNPAYAGIPALRAALDGGALSDEALVRHYLERIERFDARGPSLHALITLNPQAPAQARGRDREHAGAGAKARGALDGIPFIVKDNFDSAGLPTSGGSAVLRQSIPARNAFVLQRLLDQGAILIGKSNLSELAASYGRLGYSSAGGLTLNPYNRARDASGSSSGSAAAVAADFAAFALGTDTSGSVRAPASVTALAGLRPSFGLLSRRGILPASLTFDTPGILAHRVQEIASVLDAIAAMDPLDAATLDAPRGAGAGGYAAAAAAPPRLRGLRLGVIVNFRGGNAEVDAIETATLARLAHAGVRLMPVRLPAAFEHLWPDVLAPVGEAEFRPQFERYLGALPASPVHTLRELIAASESPAIAGTATPVNPARLAALQAADSSPLTDSPTYIRILTQLLPLLRAELGAIGRREQVAAFIFSTMSCPATPRFDVPDPGYECASDDPYRAGYLASVTGWPEITLPAGRATGNVPVGVSLLSTPFSDARLLALASAVERLLPAAPPPELR